MTTPTNEPKMPEVIYVAEFDGDPQSMAFLENDGRDTSYTRTDKVQELKEALEASYQMHYHALKCPSCIGALVAGGNLCDEHLKLTTKAVLARDKALTKPSNLLK